MKFRNAFFLLLVVTGPCFALQTLFVNESYVYEMYEPEDCIPLSVLDEGMRMYFEAYQFPRLYEGISLEELHIDETRFKSYEEFILDMLQKDFASYQDPKDISRAYFQARSLSDNQIVAICAVLKLTQSGHYYMDHLGVHKDFRRQGIASTILKEVINTFPDLIEMSLDTRIFNKPAQALYEKTGFKKLDINPNPRMHQTYIHYVLTNN